MTVMILIPCKDLGRGKSRLAACLSPRARRALCEFFLCHTLDVATAAVDPASVRVVTGDARVASIAGEYGVAAIPDGGADLNEALARGRERIAAEHSDCAAVILPTDLPLATPEALARVIVAQRETVIVPDEAGDGTNVLRLAPAALRAFRFAFGPQSYRQHCARARELGYVAAIVRDPRLMFDVDSPEQYRRWTAM